MTAPILTDADIASSANNVEAVRIIERAVLAKLQRGKPFPLDDLDMPIVYDTHAIDEVTHALTGDEGEDDSLTVLNRLAHHVQTVWPGKSAQEVLTELEEANEQGALPAPAAHTKDIAWPSAADMVAAGLEHTGQAQGFLANTAFVAGARWLHGQAVLAIAQAAVRGFDEMLREVHPSQAHWPDDHASVVKEAVAYNNGKWPDQLGSGTMFFMGKRITQAEFQTAARASRAGKKGR